MTTTIGLTHGVYFEVEESFDDVVSALRVPDGETPDTHHVVFNLDNGMATPGRVRFPASAVLTLIDRPHLI